MNSNIAVENNKNLDIWSDEKSLIEIKSIFAPKLTQVEFKIFVEMGKKTRLNPYLKEIWAVKYSDNASAQVFIGRDGYRKTAQDHKEYDYHQCDAIYENDEFIVKNGDINHSYKMKDRGALIGGYCVAKRKNSSRPMYVIIDINEYSTSKSLWNKDAGKPATMIKKVAESQCLRMCFQDIFSGTYSEEEYEIIKEEKINNFSNEQENIIDISKFSIDESTGECLHDEKQSLITAIDSIIKEKNIPDERRQKAFKFFGVSSIEEMDEEQLTRMLEMILKIK